MAKTSALWALILLCYVTQALGFQHMARQPQHDQLARLVARATDSESSGSGGASSGGASSSSNAESSQAGSSTAAQETTSSSSGGGSQSNVVISASDSQTSSAASSGATTTSSASSSASTSSVQSSSSSSQDSGSSPSTEESQPTPPADNSNNNNNNPSPTPTPDSAGGQQQNPSNTDDPATSFTPTTMTVPTFASSTVHATYTISDSPAPAAGFTNTTIGSTDGRLQFSNRDWILSNSDSCGANVRESSNKGATITFQFTGTAIYMNVVQNTQGMQYSVAVDGAIDVVNGWSASQTCGVGWSSWGLTNKQHTVVVTLIGPSASAPSGSTSQFQFSSFTISTSAGSTTTASVLTINPLAASGARESLKMGAMWLPGVAATYIGLLLSLFI